MDKQQLTTYVPAEAVDVIESVATETKCTDELPSLSKSKVAAEIISVGLEEIGDHPEIGDLLDPVEIEVYRKQREYDRLQKQGRIEDMRGGWRGRVRSRFNGRLSGAEPYHPDVMEDLAEMYFSEIEIWESDEVRIEEHRQWLDDLVAEYRDAYRCKSTVPSDSFEEAVDDVATGAELLRLRESFGEVLTEIAESAEGTGYDPDAILDALSAEFAVEEETIEIILAETTEDRVDPRQALKSGAGIMSDLDPVRLQAWDLDPARLHNGAEPEGATDD
jgi:hypothetical protein